MGHPTPLSPPPAADWRRLLPLLRRAGQRPRFVFDLLSEPAPVPLLQRFRPAEEWGL